MDRKQYVVLNGKTSTTCSATSGVPQGSVLGPLLFLIYINDSVDSAVIEGNCITLYYADDMLLYKIINNPQNFICVYTTGYQQCWMLGHWEQSPIKLCKVQNYDCNEA